MADEGSPPIEISLGRWRVRTFCVSLFALYLWHGFFSVAITQGKPGLFLVALFLATLTAMIFRWVVKPSSVVIGDDGIALSRSRQRFLPIDAILGVEQKADSTRQLGGLVVHRRGDHPLLLRFPRGRPDYEAARARITDAMRRAQERRAGTLAMIERRERSIEAWRAELHKGITRPADFRNAALDKERVREILEDTTASTEHRLGAALALQAAGADVQHVRIAARGIADEPLRIALEKIAENEAAEAEIETALEVANHRRPI